MVAAYLHMSVSQAQAAMTVREMHAWVYHITVQQWEQPSQESWYSARIAMEVKRIACMLANNEDQPGLDDMKLTREVTGDSGAPGVCVATGRPLDETYYNEAVTAVAKAALVRRLGKQVAPQ